MPHRMLEQAIDLIREGKTEAGARMLQIAIDDPQLSNTFRATAYAWLAETRDDLHFKIQCLNRALDSDPNNKQIQERLNTLLAVQPSTREAPVQRPPQPDTPPGGYNPRPSMADSQRLQGGVNPDSQPLTLPQFNPDEPLKDSGYQTVNPRQDQQFDSNAYPAFDDTDSMSNTRTFPAMPNIQPNEQQGGMRANMPPPQQAQRRYRLQETPRVVGIHQGPNGIGTGVFVSNDGIVATTRYVVGGNEEMSVELETGQQLPARVIRTYPEYDLAFLQTDVMVERVWPPTQVPVLSDNESFIVVGFNAHPKRGYQRKSKNELSHYWIPTTIELAQLQGAGGNAIFDNQNYLVGLLTRNASRASGLTYGLHILHIYECLNQYLRDRQQSPNSGYCTNCGSQTRAQQFGGFYCETCGAILPGLEAADRRYRSTPQLLRIYNENLSRPCPNCSAKVGYQDGRCLRCGYDLDSGRR